MNPLVLDTRPCAAQLAVYFAAYAGTKLFPLGKVTRLRAYEQLDHYKLIPLARYDPVILRLRARYAKFFE